MTTEELGEGTRKLYAKIQKLLNLAANNPNEEEEATAAAAMAQKLLTEYNLDASLVETAGSDDGRREEIKTRGGFYKFERYLWHKVAELTDSRSGDYTEKFGESSWELDALSPEVISSLIETNVRRVRDEVQWNKSLAQEVEYIDYLDTLIDDFGG
jgi:hypothetical protein